MIMTDEQINISIAEARGWKYEKNETHAPDGSFWWSKEPEFPNYLNDLNAMHEAEKVFDTALYCRYINELCDLTIKGNNSMYMATARQRAEAFLKTIEKWNSNKI